MIPTKIKGEVAVWAAMLGIALNAFWPLLAGMNPGIPDPSGSEVCTANGLLAVSDSGLQLPEPHGPAHRLIPHCAFCGLASGHALLQSAGLPALQVEPSRQVVPPGRAIAVFARIPFVPYGVRSPPA